MEQIIRANGITKAFPGTLALSGVDFDLQPGKIHALVGENGAGKSTLMHILAGVYQADEGELVIEGEPTKLRDPSHAQQLGISTVFQELALFPNLNVAENIFTNSQPTNRQGLIQADEMCRATKKALEAFGVDLDPLAPLYRYSVATQQIVEIARAIQRQAKVLILDEPTSAIGERETGRLMKVLRMLRDQGVGIIYISHKLDEVFALAEKITVLKDGCVVGSLKTEETDQEEVVRMMVGRDLKQMFPPKEKKPDRDGDGGQEPLRSGLRGGRSEDRGRGGSGYLRPDRGRPDRSGPGHLRNRALHGRRDRNPGTPD